MNPGSTLKLGQARGVVLLAPARAGLPVFEYAANLVKKSVTGQGHADKRQIAMMVGRRCPASTPPPMPPMRWPLPSATPITALPVAFWPSAWRPPFDRQAERRRRSVDTDSAVIDVGGVGYLVSASSRTLRDLVAAAM